jgi:hypothetical protein
MSDTEIELRWKGHAYDVNFDEYPNGLEQATLADLKEKAKRITGVPVNAMKLLASGGKPFENMNCLLPSLLSDMVYIIFFFFSSCDEGRLFTIVIVRTTTGIQSTAIGSATERKLASEPKQSH